MTKRKMTENEQSEMEEENAEMKSKIIKLQDSLLEKTEECCELKIKMKEMEVKIEKLEETVKGIKEKPVTSLDVKPSRILSSKDREAVYAMIEGWSFHGEIERMNYNVLRWIDKTVGIFRLKHLRILDTAVSPKRFMEYLADGFMLYRLAQILNEEQQHTQVMERKKRYEYFYNFAKEKAQLPDGCIFLYDELFDQSYDNYKSVFSTFYILAEQAREKFNKKTLQEIEHEDYQEKFMHGQNAFFTNHQQSKMRNSNFQF